ncbi:hypothetical protein BGZ65_008561 [Modicella reniformis]|uniref:ubiquitinyl hydrolase 1 n=1 Tax=Modicella reniformis TaxID=1440133 RepID=A0A9P6MB61_9FUNG|nr:hypothetical protein BGZ65_008561 [Modicella reniformis]
MIEPMKPKMTIQQCELQDGDIIVFQRDLTSKETNELKELNLRVSISQHYEYIANQLIVDFKPKNDQDGSLSSYTIELTKRSTYDQVAVALGTKLGTDPMHIQFTSASYPNGLPKHTIKRSTNMVLHEMLSSGHNHPVVGPNILYYEVLGISIVELESKRLIKVTWLGSTLKDESTHEFLLLKTSCMSAVVDALLSKVKPTLDGSQTLRIFSVMNGRNIRNYVPTDPISITNDMLNLYVEEIPKEEAEAGEGELLLQCFHFQTEVTRTHGIPFKILVKDGEKFAATKARVHARLGINDKEFAKIKFIFCNGSTGRITSVADVFFHQITLFQYTLYAKNNLASTTLTSLAGATGLV